ncbi:MAG: acyl-CoA thioesterase [Betaproteobacteria bacterium]|nr:acyl-CoA thioesterase [Betaproteobacteria bacterium]
MRFELPAEKKLVHEMVVPLRWGEMDSLGHVNNTVYFRYMEIVRLDWIFKIGGRTDPTGQGLLIVNAFCNFLRQLDFPGNVRVTMFVAKPGRSSFESYHTLERTDEPGVICAEGGARIVWADYPAKKSVPLPDWLRAQLA